MFCFLALACKKVTRFLVYRLHLYSTLTSLNSFCKDPGFNWVLSIILIATSLPVGTCLASFTLAKLPLPIVFSSLYFPIVGSSPVLDLFLVDAEPILDESTVPSFPPCKKQKTLTKSDFQKFRVCECR